MAATHRRRHRRLHHLPRRGQPPCRTPPLPALPAPPWPSRPRLTPLPAPSVAPPLPAASCRSQNSLASFTIIIAILSEGPLPACGLGLLRASLAERVYPQLPPRARRRARARRDHASASPTTTGSPSPAFAATRAHSRCPSRSRAPPWPLWPCLTPPPAPSAAPSYARSCAPPPRRAFLAVGFSLRSPTL